MPPKKSKKGGCFDGLTFCISGNFTIKQNEMKSLLTDNGGQIASTVTKIVTHVVSDQIGSSKTVTAVDKGLPVVSEDWVNTSIEEGSPSTDSSLFISGGDDDDSGSKKKKSSSKKKAKDEDEEEEDEEEEEEEEDEKPKKKAASKKAAPKKSASKKKSGGAFDGLTFCVSGSFTCSQNEMKSSITDNGGKIASTVTKAVTHVVSDQIGSGKTQTAVDKGIPVVSEDWINTSIEEGAPSTDEALFVSGGDDMDDDDDKPAAKSKAKPKAAAASKKRKKADDDDEEEEEDEEDDKPAPEKSAAKKSTSKKAAKKDDDDEEDDDADDEPAAKKSKSDPADVKKVTLKKGSAPVDEHCPGRDSCTVYQEGSAVWDAMLNQTNIGHNNNKYYVIQLLQKTDGSYQVWTKWGRVGKINGSAMFPYGKNLDGAKKQFDSKFRDKTKNYWADRANFVKHSGKYHLLERDYSADDAEMEDDDDGGEEKKDGGNKNNKNYPDSKLDARVQDLVKLICDVKMMEAALIEVGYDAKKLPLGKLSKNHIQQGYRVLQQISDALDTGKGNLVDLSSDFYTLIPHDFGMSRPPVIRDKIELKKKLNMVEQLADIEIATKLLKGDGANHKVNPLDAHYEHLKCEMTPLESDSDEVALIKKYVKNTHASTHTHYALDVLEVFDLTREGEEKRFKPYEDNENRMLLWHGSRLTNFVGILSQGLRIAPPEAPVTGYMFGKGVYFADMVSKSANYCATSRDSNIACMLLCEVALGDMNQKLAADYHADKLPSGKLSTLGAGKTCPDPKHAQTMDDGVVVPCGPGIASGISGSTLLYNEFIVYKTEQIKMRYLIKMRFNYK